MSDSVARYNFAYCNINNWGDQLNPYLISRMVPYGTAINALSRDQLSEQPHYLCIGSIAHWATRHTCLWGAGSFKLKRRFRFEDPGFKCVLVRGPRTRRQLVERGVDCPELYGDPGLLVSRYYSPQIPKAHAVGVIPHHKELADGVVDWRRVEQDRSIRIINIAQPVESFVDELLSCEVIISSALHGIIAAHAYGLPVAWFTTESLSLKDFVNYMKGTHRFKYDDYMESVDISLTPHRMKQSPQAGDIAKIASNAAIFPGELSTVQDRIYRACPFAPKESSEG